MSNGREDVAVREVLHALTADQPEQPVDRLAGIRRRHVRRRSGQLAGAAFTAVAAVVGGLLAGGVVGNRSVEPLSRDVPSWALPWPDHRDGSVSQRVLDGAVLSWRQTASETTAPLSPPRRVIWYAGQTVSSGEYIAVVFEVDGDTGRRLVAGTASTDSVTGASASRVSSEFTPWVLYDVPAPPPGFAGFVGLNFPGRVAADGVEDAALLLTAPRDGVRLYVVDRGTYPPLRDGLAVFDAGPTYEKVHVLLIRRDGSIAARGDVGVPGAPTSEVPQLMKPAPLQVPSGGRSFETSGQGSVATFDAAVHGTGKTTIYARCFGPSPIAVSIDVDHIEDGLRIPCDDRQHVIEGPRIAPATQVTGPGTRKGHWVSVHAPRMDSWRVRVVIEHK